VWTDWFRPGYGPVETELNSRVPQNAVQLAAFQEEPKSTELLASIVIVIVIVICMSHSYSIQ
jgi:hypothetical protein